jgi:hypothetical protein
MDVETRTPPAAAHRLRRGSYRATRTDPLGLSARERCVLNEWPNGPEPDLLPREDEQ